MIALIVALICVWWISFIAAIKWLLNNESKPDGASCFVVVTVPSAITYLFWYFT